MHMTLSVGCCGTVLNVHFMIMFRRQRVNVVLITFMRFVEPDPERAVATMKYIQTVLNECLFCWILNTGQNATLIKKKN